MKKNKHLFPWAVEQSYYANPKNFILYNACFVMNSLLFPVTIFLREQLFSSALMEIIMPNCMISFQPCFCEKK